MSKSIAVEVIATRILEIRGKKVMLDRDLAKLYGVAVKVLNQAVKRNTKRFPSDFMFQLSWEEAESSRSQIVTLKQGLNIKYLPLEKKYAEHDETIKGIFEAIKQLLGPPPAKEKRIIGFKAEK